MRPSTLRDVESHQDWSDASGLPPGDDLEETVGGRRPRVLGVVFFWESFGGRFRDCFVSGKFSFWIGYRVLSIRVVGVRREQNPPTINEPEPYLYLFSLFNLLFTFQYQITFSTLIHCNLILGGRYSLNQTTQTQKKTGTNQIIHQINIF